MLRLDGFYPEGDNWRVDQTLLLLPIIAETKAMKPLSPNALLTILLAVVATFSVQSLLSAYPNNNPNATQVGWSPVDVAAQKNNISASDKPLWNPSNATQSISVSYSWGFRRQTVTNSIPIWGGRNHHPGSG